MKKKVCRNCAYWEEVTMECRCDSPWTPQFVVSYRSGENIFPGDSYWPKVDPDWWCGEFSLSRNKKK